MKDAMAMAEKALGSATSVGSAYFEDAERVVTKKDAALLLTTFVN